MTERKLKIGVARFMYGGNGTVQTMLPGLGDWYRNLTLKCKDDERVEALGWADYTDTPISMTRCKSVLDARRHGFDILIMCDNDNLPDVELGADPEAKPFWDTSFDFMYNHWDKGPTLVMAPYCGAPPIECPFGFHWKNFEFDTPEPKFQLKMYEREECAIMRGIQECAAGPTGLSMWDMRLFDLIPHPYFDYEWTDETHSEKASTEDVFTTRNVSLAGIQKLGYNPVFINWDAWAGHAKPKMVRKPRIMTADMVHKSLADAVKRGLKRDDRMIEVKSDLKPGRLFHETGLPTADEQRRGELLKQAFDLEGASIFNVTENKYVPVTAAHTEFTVEQAKRECMANGHG